jgi:hypothetical protein
MKRRLLNSIKHIGKMLRLQSKLQSQPIRSCYLRFRHNDDKSGMATGIYIGKVNGSCGIWRCQNSLGIRIYKQNYDQTMKLVMANPQLKREIGMGNEVKVPTPIVLKDDEKSVALAINYRDLVDCYTLVPADTLLGAWLRNASTDQSSMEKFLDQRSKLGNTFMDCISHIKATKSQTVKRGQTVAHEGTAIMAKRYNFLQQGKDAGGNKLPSDRYQLVRASMGKVGGITDKRCQEFITPALSLVNRVLSAWPQKLDNLPPEVSNAFDGSRKLSYLNMLVTIGGVDNDSHVTYCVKEKEGCTFLQHYATPNAGTWIHNDEDNTPDTPCVAIMFGAYSGFNFAFPTCGIEVFAPSGTIVVSSMRDLIHAVGGGIGIRITLVFCQHEVAVKGIMQHNDTYKILHGARPSKTDIDVRQNGGVVPTIVGLDQYDFH